MIATNVLLILPLAIPIAAGAVTLLLWMSDAKRWISIVGMLLHLAAAVFLLLKVRSDGILATPVGAWPFSVAITLVADHLSAVLVVMTAFIGTVISIYAIGGLEQRKTRLGFYPLLHLLVGGVCGAFLTGDLFNLYVWFEVLLVSSFALMALGSEPRQLQGSLKYVIVSLIGSAFFLAGIGLLYGATGTLHLGKLASFLNGGGRVAASVAVLFLVAFGVKAAVIPFHFWLPSSYPTPPLIVGALLAGLLTKVGVYAILRMFTTVFTADPYVLTLLLWLGGITMIGGVAGALAQKSFRRLLAFQVVATIGFMLAGIGLYTRMSIAGSVFYLVEDMVVITNLFLLAGILERSSGSEMISEMGGLYRRAPSIAAAFLIPALSLASFPPSAGFWSKLILGRAGFETGRYAIVVVMILAGLVMLLIVANVWVRAFLAPRNNGGNPMRAVPVSMWTPVVTLAAVTVFISLWASPLFEIAAAAAAELMDPGAYINAALGR